MSNRSFMTQVLLAALLGCVPVPGASAFELPDIEFQPRQYYCRPAEDQVAIDGLLTERAWTRAEVSAEFVDITGAALAQPDWSTRVRMTYDDVYFYVAAEMEEPHVWATLNRRDAVIYQDNDFEVFIDPDGDNHHYYELEINALGTEWDLLLIRPYRDGGPAVNAWDIQGLKTAVHVDGTLNDPSDTDKGWTVEIAIPWEVLGQAAGRRTPPGPGDIWRVNFSRVQWRTTPQAGRYEKMTNPETGKTVPEQNWVWSPQGLIAMHYPEMWGEVMFTGGQEIGFEDSPEHASIMTANLLMPLYYDQKLWYEDKGSYARTLDELGFDPSVVPPGWTLELAGDGTFFRAALKTPDATATIDNLGRLERNP
jgi:hypothetical protein